MLHSFAAVKWSSEFKQLSWHHYDARSSKVCSPWKLHLMFSAVKISPQFCKGHVVLWHKTSVYHNISYFYWVISSKCYKESGSFFHHDNQVMEQNITAFFFFLHKSRATYAINAHLCNALDLTKVILPQSREFAACMLVGKRQRGNNTEVSRMYITTSLHNM